MTKYQFRVLATGLGFLIVLMLWATLPAWGWAVIGLVALSFGMCWTIERAIRKVWRR